MRPETSRPRQITATMFSGGQLIQVEPRATADDDQVRGEARGDAAERAAQPDGRGRVGGGGTSDPLGAPPERLAHPPQLRQLPAVPDEAAVGVGAEDEPDPGLRRPPVAASSRPATMAAAFCCASGRTPPPPAARTSLISRVGATGTRRGDQRGRTGRVSCRWRARSSPPPRRGRSRCPRRCGCARRRACPSACASSTVAAISARVWFRHRTWSPMERTPPLV